MALTSVPADYRWKARKCRFLVESSTEEAMAKILAFLAHEYDAAAASMERAEQSLMG